MINARNALALGLGAVALLSAPRLEAQSFLMPTTPTRGVWLEATHANLRLVEVDLPTTVWYLSGRLPVGDRLAVVADLPYSHARVQILGTTESNSVVGNPFLGLQLAATPRVEVEVGTRLPLTTADAESFADAFAIVADPERLEAFADRMVPLVARATWRHPVSASLALRAHGGVTGFFSTRDEDRDNDAAVDYGALLSHDSGGFRVGGGVSGRWFATAEEGSLSDNTIHHAGISADAPIGRIRPGLSLRVPLDSDYRRVVSSSMTVYVQVPLR